MSKIVSFNNSPFDKFMASSNKTEFIESFSLLYTNLKDHFVICKAIAEQVFGQNPSPEAIWTIHRGFIDFMELAEGEDEGVEITEEDVKE